MNEKVKKILPYFIVFIAGAFVCGGLSGLWVSSSLNNRIAVLKEQTDSMRRENQNIRDSNTELKQTVDRDRAIKQQLRDSIEKQSRAIEAATKYISDTITANSEAGKYNREALEILDGIIERYQQARKE